VEKEELGFVVGVICFFDIKKCGGRGKLKAVAGLNLEVGIGFSEL